jgi:hypothetical protein
VHLPKDREKRKGQAFAQVVRDAISRTLVYLLKEEEEMKGSEEGNPDQE